MKERELIPLSDFICEKVKYLEEEHEYDSFQFLTEVEKYNLFLRLSLSEPYEVNGVTAHPINMFVAADLEGNVLEEPRRYDEWIIGVSMSKHQNEICNEFNEAKSRVIFEGFEFDYGEINPVGHIYVYTNKEGVSISVLDDSFMVEETIINKIQDLTKLGLTSTETGAKMAGL